MTPPPGPPDVSSDGGAGEACVVNLGPAQTRLRRVVGVVGLSAALALAVAAWRGGWPLPAALLALPPFAFGVLGLLQARAKT